MKNAWILISSMWLTLSIFAGLFIYGSLDGIGENGELFFKNGNDIYCFALITDSYDEDFE